MKKEYGRLSLDQLKQLRKNVGEFRALSWEIESSLKSKDGALKEIFNQSYSWADLYQMSLTDHVVHLTVIMGLSSHLSNIASQDDPQQSALDLNHQNQEFDNNFEQSGFEKQDLFGCAYSLGRTILCVQTYDFFMNELIEMASNGNDSSLFKAVRIDRSVTSCPPIADRISIAEIEQDAKFFRKLGEAYIKGPEPPDMEYIDLRYLLITLEGENVLENLSMNDEYNLFVRELGVYPDTDDAKRNLHQFIYRWKNKRKSTQTE